MNPWILSGIVLALALVLSGSYPLLDPDEGRNAEVAREMAASRDFLVPRLAGMPYLDKPPGYFWAASLAIGIAGNRPWAARLPAAVSAALVVWLLCRTASRRDSPGLGVRAGLLLAAAPLFAVLSAYVIFDMPLALCVTAVWTALADELERGPNRHRRLFMFAAVAAGILIKGPVMLAWAVGGSLGAALLVRSRSPLSWLAWLPGWAVVVGVAGGWFLLASLRHPEYPRYAFLEESLERMTTGSFHRDQPWWFVPVVLAGGALPWSFVTPWSRRLGVASKVALGFVLFAALFFTASRSKLVTYLLPALPPLAWVAAEAWTHARGVARAAWACAGVYALLAILLAGIGRRGGAIGLPGLATVEPRAAYVLAALLIVAAVLAAWAGFARQASVAFAASLAFTPLTLAAAGPALARFAASQSGAPLARAILSATPRERVRYEHCYSPGTDFLLGRISDLVSPRGRETTSNYQLRYRDLLMRRGQWTALASAPEGAAAVVVRPARGGPADAPAGIEFHRDARFVAYRPARAASTPPAAGARPAAGER